ncbi:MAG: cupin-like domain-containing protein, partial [Gammaproteobacteria bacterium]|nr:cupin-like domain-containing protein [Gammaproteobacteria bacterium]NNJ72942.1 cupin-like domain-containing protein [Enterobacterales bacterium]
MTSNFGTAVDCIDCTSGQLPENFEALDKPYLLKGLVSHWPIVKAAKQSNEAAVEELLNHYSGDPVGAFLAHAEAGGRFFYNDNVDGFNFIQSNVYLNEILQKLLELQGQTEVPTYYVGSLEIQEALPGFLNSNDLPLNYENIRKSIWLGNRSLVATHYDFPDNIACCVLGQRRFTLFPPEQLENLYVGPLDLTPAGQQISMVDIRNP